MKIAQQYFQLVGGSASECGKIFVIHLEFRLIKNDDKHSPVIKVLRIMHVNSLGDINL